MPSKVDLEERLRARYHQPKGVEQFGIEAIPPQLKTVKWFDLFSIVFNFLVNPGVILVGGLAVAAGLSFWQAIIAETGGVVLAFVAYITMATVGVDYGIPGQVATRMAFGLRGAKWVTSVLRTIASIYWFAFQTLAGALAIVAVLDKWLGGHFSLISVSLVFAALQVVVAVVGYNSLKLLSRFALPIKIVILVYLMGLLITHPDPAFSVPHVLGYPGAQGPHWVIFATWLNVSAAAWLTMITDAADFCRYSRTRADMWVGTLAAAATGTFVAGFIGAYGAAATLGKVPNTFEVLADLSTSWLTLLLVFIVIALDNWTINVLNLYTGGLSLSNMFERLGRFWTTLIVSVLGVALSAAPSVVNGYTDYVGVLGNTFAPIAGVLIVDYVLIKRSWVDIAALFERAGPYWYWGGFNAVAILWVVIGFAVCTLLVPIAWIPTMIALLVSGIGYYTTMLLLASRSPALRMAARPGEQRETIEALDEALVLRP
ncbi:MAG: cytosine permease [Acetobacteraceae bacterium]|nr:cytosine permease [Acetobacteraceae bacterium]